MNRIPALQQGQAWLLLVGALGLHVADEAATGFLDFYNPLVQSIRARLPWFPMPTFQFEVWLVGLILLVLLLASVTPLIRRGGAVAQAACWGLSVIMSLNGLGHLLGSIYYQQWLPGATSAPLLLASSCWLGFRTWNRNRPGNHELQRRPQAQDQERSRRSPAMSRGVLYIEVQRFRQWWIWLICLGNLALMLGVFGWGMFQQLVRGRPWGDKPLSDPALLAIGFASIGFSLGLLWLFIHMRLEVRVEPEALSIRFRPFVHRRIRYEQIVGVRPKTYRPVAEYGGWGIRWSPRRGMAYNVSGNQGVLLELSNGKCVMIGSHRPDYLAAAITQQRGM